MDVYSLWIKEEVLGSDNGFGYPPPLFFVKM
jgi:hypothetical protein